MQTLSIDIETYSPTNLKTSGVYRYAEDPDFEILLIGYSFDGKTPEVIDVTSIEETDCRAYEQLETIKDALTDPTILKTAHNANFERVCLSAYFNVVLPPEQWECTMAKSAMQGLPLSLDAVSKVLGLSEQKDATGKQLIRYFTAPCKPSKANGMRSRNMPSDAPEKWEAFKSYCAQDVVVELAIREKIESFKIPDFERRVWALDQKINDAGILLDRGFIEAAIRIDEAVKSDLYDEALKLTGLDNPNSAAQLKDWLAAEMPLENVDTLRKQDIPILRASAAGYNGSDSIKRVLDIRAEMSKTSSKKYSAMLNYICADNRIRGIHQYYGANRTGRWAGRGVQPQNMYKNKIADIDVARSVVLRDDRDLLDFVYGDTPEIISQLIRTSFVASPGRRLLITDFSAIEARVIAWLAGEKWRLDVFATHGKIYEASAAQMFKIPIESVTKTSDYRAKAKIAELALGFQGGVNALLKMDSKKELKAEELPEIVRAWRSANKRIVDLWTEVETAALMAVGENRTTRLRSGKVSFEMRGGVLYVQLPSERPLCYQRARLREGKFGKMALVYDGMDQTTKLWTAQDTYGGKLVENIVQGIARDCLATALIRIDEAAFDIGMHVHDEIVIDAPPYRSADEIDAIIAKPMPWALDLSLRGDTTESAFYKKD